ncbi:MAG: hypothetical protein AABZ10_13135 [Nitrospirota bacterium]
MRKCRWEITAAQTTCAIVMTGALVFLPRPSSGDARRFIPALSDYDGDVEIGMTSETNENTYGGSGLKTSDTTAMERLRLVTTGYIYHPRFILFRLGGAGGFLQEDFESTSSAASHTTRSANEYEVRTFILPEHPYNLELYTLQRSPLIKGRFSQATPRSRERGAIFRYTRRPLFAEMSATENTTSGLFSYTAKTYRGNIGHYLGPFFNSAGYAHTQSTTSQNIQTTRNDEFFSNELNLTFLTLSSRFETDRQKQEDPLSASLSTETVSWIEQLSTELPGNLNAVASFNFLKDTRTTEQTTSSPENVVFNKSDNAGFVLSHRLYNSLRTNYNVNYVSAESTGGDTRTASQALTSAYTKKIPTGTFFAGINLSNTHSEIRGAPVVVREVHALPGPIVSGVTFFLNAQPVDETTIDLRVKDPLSGNLVPMTLVSNYQINKLGNTVQIVVLSLPFPVDQNLSVTYEFHASYSLIPSNVEFETRTEGYNLKFEIFDNLLAPYYSHTATIQEVLSGSLPGSPDSLTMETIGVIVQKMPYIVTTEYGSARSRLNPYRTWKNMAEYRKNMAETTSMTARISRTYSTYPEAIAWQGTKGYTEKITRADVTMQKSFPRKNLDLFLGGSYSDRNSFIHATGYSLNATLSWRIGMLTANLGAIINDSSSTLQTGKQTLTYEYYYLTLTRKLF